MVKTPSITSEHVCFMSSTTTECNVLFFITDVNDTKVILGSKACQEFKLVRILCDDRCQCKTMRFEIWDCNSEWRIFFWTKCSLQDHTSTKTSSGGCQHQDRCQWPKTHILQLFPDLFEGIETMEDAQVHLDVDPKIEPFVQAPHKIPLSILEQLKAEIEC